MKQAEWKRSREMGVGGKWDKRECILSAAVYFTLYVQDRRGQKELLNIADGHSDVDKKSDRSVTQSNCTR